ncbi:hypothetical protein NST04_28650 [Paenibacillus sp. FSL H7-0756]|uniref:hypothetical protein n=1 Tax=unclassified Paenibacillus TaxID=185978 RepID=UPI0030F9EAD5
MKEKRLPKITGEETVEHSKGPHNPGMSQQAWDKLHRMLAETNIKYQAEIAAGRESKEESAG